MSFIKMIRASRFISSVALSVLATLLSHHVVRANMLLNGSFESPVITTGTYLDIPPGGEPAGFDWKVGTGNIDLFGPNQFVLYPPYNGVQALDLNGFVRGSIYQDFPTVLGQQYSLTFAYADNPLEGGVSSADVTVTDLVSNGTLLATSVFHSTSTNGPPPNGDWILYSGTFEATGTSTRLLFASTSASNSASGGIILDDVIVQAIPEPSAFVLTGLGLLGMGIVARRSKYRRLHTFSELPRKWTH